MADTKLSALTSALGVGGTDLVYIVHAGTSLQATWTQVASFVGGVAQIAESQVTNLTTDLAAKAPLASPTFTGTPVAPTALPGTNTTQLATTAFVQAGITALGLGSAATHSASDFDAAGAAAAAQTAAQNYASNASNLASGTVGVARLPVLVASGTSHAAGIAPDPGASAGATRFLREDATWATPSGGGAPGGVADSVQTSDGAGGLAGNDKFLYDQRHVFLGDPTLGGIDTFTFWGGPAWTTLNVVETLSGTDTSSTGVAFCVNANFNINETVDGSLYWGVQGWVQTDPANAHNPDTMVGVGAYAYHQGTGTIRSCEGLECGVQNQHAGGITTARGINAYVNNFSTGTIGTAQVILVSSNTNSHTNTLYGIYVDDLAGSATNVWAIKTGSGLVEFGDTVQADKVIVLQNAIASASAPNNSFFRDSGRSNKLSYKGVAGAVTTIEA